MGTTVALPVVRGPAPLAKTLAAVDHLSGGRLFVGVGPGSSARDYAATGVDFEERWKRLDEAVAVLRHLWCRDEDRPFLGKFYSTEGVRLEAVSPATARAANMDRQLGIGGRSSPDRPPGGRLAGVSL